jgi:hypothetical protein
VALEIAGKLRQIHPVSEPGVGRQTTLDRNVIQKRVHQMIHADNFLLA